jgi:hypothetical protein
VRPREAGVFGKISRLKSMTDRDLINSIMSAMDLLIIRKIIGRVSYVLTYYQGLR